MNIKKIESRARLASDAAPWDPNVPRFYDYTPEMLAKCAQGGPWHRAACASRVGDGVILALTGPIDDKQSVRDAEFYSHAKEDVLALLERISELQAANRRF